MRRTLTALGLVALAACGGGGRGHLTRAAGTTTTSTSTVTSSTSTTVAPAPAPSTTRRTTTTRSTIPGPVVITYQVEVHAADAATLDVASVVKATLDDPRGWRRAGFDFQLVDGNAPYTILIAEGAEVQQRCRPYDTYGKYSCQLGPLVAITADRWRHATPEWPGDLATYRQMLLGHEVGHLIGLHHRRCGGAGLPAPVMSQQGTNLDGCQPNPWPLPEEIARAARHDLPIAPGYEPGSTPDPP